MQLRTQKIYVVRDDMEPEEGPYWSAHVDLLIREARSLKLNVQETKISETEHISKIEPHDLILYRPTYLGVVRREFCTQIKGLNGFVINRTGLKIGNKISFSHFCREHQIPTPKTWSRESFKNAVDMNHISSGMSFVIKKSNSAQGKGIFRAFDIQHCLAQLKEIKKNVVIQEFCDMEKPIYDMRLMLVGTKFVGGMKRVLYSNDPMEFRTNLALGTSVAKKYTPTEEVLCYAKKIQQKSALDWVGIDVILHREKHLFLECNTAPGLKGISQVCPKITQKVLRLLLQRALESQHVSE
jgi:glutathione synthase/RimK-type ligase-like ATP-grasp enzyme